MEFASSSGRFSVSKEEDEEASPLEIPFMTAAATTADTGAAAAAASSSSPSAAASASASGSAAALRSSDGAGASGSGGGRCDDVEVIEKEHMFDKVVTPSDVGKLKRLVIPKQHAEKYFPLDAAANEKGLLLSFEDRAGKLWRFRYSYWNSSQSYVMTKGWSRFVKEKRLDAGDTVSFCRGAGEAARDRLFIDWKRRADSRDPHWMPRPPLPMAPVASSFMPPAPPATLYEHHRFGQALDLRNINAAAPARQLLFFGSVAMPPRASMPHQPLPPPPPPPPLPPPPPPPLHNIMMVQPSPAVTAGQLPMVLDSVPLVNSPTAAAKRVRLFGVNLDNPQPGSSAESSQDANALSLRMPGWQRPGRQCNQQQPPPLPPPPLHNIMMVQVQPRESKSGHGEGEPARPVGDAKRSPKAEPAGDAQVEVCSASIRRLFQQLVHVRTTISSFGGKLPSDAWFIHVKHLTSDAEESLEHLHYKMILAKLGVGTHLKKVRPNVSGTCSKTTAISFMHLLASQELVILPVTDKLEGLRHGSPGLSGAVLENYSHMFSLSYSVMRCILLCRGILGIINIVNMEGKKENLELPVFAFDDLTYAGQNKGIGMNAHSVPARMADPIYLSPMFIRSLLCLDLSSFSGLTQLPPSIGDLSNLAALNLSHCYSLHTLPVSVGRLKNLKILVLSCCHELRNLPVSVSELSKLRLLDLAGCSSLENLPASLVNLGKLENLNLSYCKELKELPQPFGNLQELRYLNISGSHRDLDVECLCTLANLKSLTLSPLTNIQGFPDSFKDLANRLDSLRWRKNQIRSQCGPKAASLHSYRGYEQSIIDMLLSDEGDISSDQIVTSACIVGESGMGKTELVHRIYNNEMILDTFDLKIWLYMCDKKTLLSKIVEITTCAYCSDASISVLEEIVIEELTSKRLLLVLDDSEIKSQYFWGYLWKLLNVCAKGSAFIVTTKSKEVAYQIGAMQTFYLSPLSKEECFMIFKEHVLEDLVMDNYCQLESFGWKFVEKCGGNPMCIKALSGLLCHSEVELSEIDMIVDGILPALRLCYDLLPAHLQQCFKFCSLFPKDYIFVKCHIIRLWIAEGFVLCEEGTQPEDTAMHYFDELCCRSFFQRSPFHNDHKDNFVMHELFHDLAQSVSKNECFRCEEPFCSLAQNVSHLSLVLSDFKTAALSNEVRNLQSFLVVRRCFPVVKIFTLDDIFVKHRFLRALNLSYTDILELPISIGNMKHLQLLALNNTKIKSLPIEIGQVNSLQTLELKDCCHLIDLPGSTSNLAKLRHLDVQKESGNVNVGMPHGIGHLTDLQILTMFNIGNDLLHCSISELKNMNGLRGHVQVTGLENIKTANDAGEANMMGKHLLEALTLEWSYQEEGMDDDMGKKIANEILQNLQPNSNIMELVIRNYAGNLFPVWMQDNYLCKLISVTLDNCHGCSELPYLGDLPSLKSLYIQRINSVESFGIETSSLATEEKHLTGFPSLEVLNICEMYDLQFWVGTREEDFPRLFHLSISRCPKLTNLPRLISLVHVSFHYGGELPTLSELPSLESLKIKGFQKIRSISFPHQLTTLKKLEIIDCKELLSVYAYSLSVSDLKVVRCLKLDLVGSSTEDHVGQKVVSGRNSLTRRPMVLKTLTYTNLLDDDSKWEKFGEKNIFGYIFARSYYTCIWRKSTGCSATKILQPNNNDPNTLFVMYISEHNHGFSNEPHLELSSQLGTGRKRKEYDVSSDENTSKKQLHDSFE